MVTSLAYPAIRTKNEEPSGGTRWVLCLSLSIFDLPKAIIAYAKWLCNIP